MILSFSVHFFSEIIRAPDCTDLHLDFKILHGCACPPTLLELGWLSAFLDFHSIPSLSLAFGWLQDERESALLSWQIRASTNTAGSLRINSTASTTAETLLMNPGPCHVCGGFRHDILAFSDTIALILVLTVHIIGKSHSVLWPWCVQPVRNSKPGCVTVLS